MINTNKKFITLFISATINILLCQSDVDVSRTVREELFEAFQEASQLVHSQKLIQEKMESELASKDLEYLDSLLTPAEFRQLFE